MKRRFLYIIVACIIIGALLWAAFFYYQNLRGIGPAFSTPSKSITEYLSVLDQQDQKEDGSLANATDFPLILSPGFRISIFAKDLGAPRVIVRDPGGTIVVSSTKQGRVVALPDEDGDGVADRVDVMLEKLNQPHGLAFRCLDAVCTLYVAESHAVTAYPYDRSTRRVGDGDKIADLPSGGGHFTRTLLLHPTDPKQLLISVGSSCNVCKERDWRRAAVLSLDLTTNELTPFVSGLRNAVFMTTHPVTKQIWVTEMGRDLIGDDLPPDEINVLNEGKNYGWPHCYGKNVHDDQWHPAKDHPCGIVSDQPSEIDLPAHSAPLGLAFTPETPGRGDRTWPDEYQYNLFVAFHGSWNKSEPTGYKIVRYELDYEGNPGTGGYVPKNFISGWLQKDGTALGRPAGILALPDGVMYITDDKAGVVYKVTVDR